MKTDLGPNDLGDLLEQPIIAVLATRRADDTTMLSPVWFDWRDGAFRIWADSEANGKVRHIRRDPRVSFVVANDAWPYKGLEVRGEATITTDDFYDVLGRTTRRYMGADEEERMMASTPPGVVIRIEPSTFRGWDYADEA